MKILHIIASADPSSGGPIEGILRQYEATKHRAEREIVTLDEPEAPFLQQLSPKVHALGARRVRGGPLGYYGYSPDLIPWLKRNISRFDRIVVNGIWNYSTFAASQVLPKCGKPYFVFTHGMLDPWFKHRYPLKHLMKQCFWLFCEGPLLASARSVLFTTKEEEVLSNGQFLGWPYKSKVVSYGTRRPPSAANVSGHEFDAAVPDLNGRPYFLFLSRLHEKKGCDLLVDAFSAFAKVNPSYHLVMAGPDQGGLAGALQLRAEAAGVADRIHWPGMLQGDAKWAAYYGAEAFILPSHQENFGIVVAEALACDTPVLISNRVNIWREVLESEAGLVEDDTASGTERLLNRFISLPPEARANMSNNAKYLFREQFDIEKNAQTTLDWIQANG